MRKESGFALIQLMIAIGILGILAAGFATMISDQQRQTAQLTDKLSALDLQRVLTSTFADGSVCGFMMTNPSPITIDPMNLGGVTFPTFTQIPARGSAGAQPVVLADSTTPVSPLSPRLTVRAIQIENLACAVTPCTPTSNSFTANMAVHFDNSKLSMKLNSVRIPLMFRTSGPPGAQTINSCSGSGGVGSGLPLDRIVVESPNESCGGSPSHTNCPGVPPFVSATCPAGYQLTGCGYKLSTWAPVNNDNAGTWWTTFHTNAPDDMLIVGDTCKVDAGGAPGCGVCFKAQAVCFKFQ